MEEDTKFHWKPVIAVIGFISACVTLYGFFTGNFSVFDISRDKNTTDRQLPTYFEESTALYTASPFTSSAPSSSGVQGSIDFVNAFSNKEIYGDTRYWIRRPAAIDNLGNMYDSTLISDCTESTQEIAYKLDRKYKKLSGTIFLLQEDKNYRRKLIYEFFGDDSLLFQSQIITTGHEPEQFSIDVTGIDRLVIKRTSPSSSIVGDWCQTGIGNFIIEYSDNDYSSHGDKNIDFLRIFFGKEIQSSRHSWISRSYNIDKQGNSYTNALELDSDLMDAFIEYNLNHQYKSLSGVFIVSDTSDKDDDPAIYEIYCDGKLLVKSKQLKNNSNPEPFSLDVTNVNRLMIMRKQPDGLGYYSSADTRIADIYITK